MGFWKSFGKWAIPIGAIAATALTGGAAAPLLGMAIGAGSGLASSKLAGQSWKQSLIGAGIGGALGGIGGGALKGMGGVGKFLGGKAGGAVLQGAAGMGRNAIAQSAANNQPQGMGAPQVMANSASTRGYLNPIGLQANRRTDMYGMGTRAYG
jgi:hypothetical protein